MEYILKLIERGEKISILEDEQHNKIELKSNKIPKEIKPGQEVFLTISKKSLKNEKAKDILNEIFQTDE